jgi:hypothetical protein
MALVAVVSLTYWTPTWSAWLFERIYRCEFDWR